MSVGISFSIMGVLALAGYQTFTSYTQGGNISIEELKGQSSEPFF